MSVSIYKVGVEHVAYYMGCKSHGGRRAGSVGGGGCGGGHQPSGGSPVAATGGALPSSLLVVQCPPRPLPAAVRGVTAVRAIPWLATTQVGTESCRAGGRLVER